MGASINSFSPTALESYSNDNITCNNILPKYWSNHSEQRTFSKRQSLVPKQAPSAVHPKENTNGSNPKHKAPMSKKRMVKKSQLMLCRDNSAKRQSTCKKFRIPVSKARQTYLERDHQHHDDPPFVNVKPLTSLKKNTLACETENNISQEEPVQQSSHILSQESSSIDDQRFLLQFPRRERGYVTIQAEDLRLLEPCGMLNDNLVDFMLKYIEMYQVPCWLQGQVHFFNSFFFTRLQSLGNLSSGHRDMESLSRWTSDVEIFSNKYLFVPICMYHHWTLAVICNAGNVMSWNSKWNNPKERPCILYFDSLGTFRGSTNCQRLLRFYLEMEWKKRMDWKRTTRVHIPRENLSIWNISAPEQKNEFDCGLFMLYYVVRFLQHPPNQGAFTNRADLCVKNWFTHEDIKVFRAKMKQLIVDLAKYYKEYPID